MSLKDRVKKIAEQAAREVANGLSKVRVEQSRAFLNAAGTILSIDQTTSTAVVKLTDGTQVTADLSSIPRVVGEPVVIIGGRIQ